MCNNIKVVGTTEKKPFTIVKCENNKKDAYFIACGKLRNETMYSSFEDAEKAIDNKDWELITLLMEQFVNYLLDNKNK